MVDRPAVGLDAAWPMMGPGLARRLELSEAAGAGPGTASQRNAERAGFRVAYTKLTLVEKHYPD